MSRRSRTRRDKRAPVPDFDEPQPATERGSFLEATMSDPTLSDADLCSITGYPRHGPSPAARAAQARAVRRSMA